MRRGLKTDFWALAAIPDRFAIENTRQLIRETLGVQWLADETVESLLVGDIHLADMHRVSHHRHAVKTRVGLELV